jgi:hypothetical protein
MKTITNQIARGASVALIAFTGLALAQDPPPASNGGWRKFGDPSPQQQQAATDQRNQSYDPGPQQQAPRAENVPQREERNYSVPPQLTLRPGTFITVRTNEMLSSDRNHAGDFFTATLERPLIVDGIIVAMRGQTISGRIVEAQKAGRVEGTSKLSVELTELTLADGQQVQVHSQLLARNGNTSVGRDAEAIATTTAAGAAIGAAADWGRGAAIGAGAGAVAGIAGVLLTRGHATVIYPESVMTFRVDAPVTISTERASQAFRFAGDEDYGRQQDTRPPPSLSQREPAPAPAPYYGGPAYDPYYNYGYGPSVGIYIGPSYGYYGRGYYGRGYYGRGYYGRGGFRR